MIEEFLKVGAISDTHNKHTELDTELRQRSLDILIHGGDGSNSKLPAQNNNEIRDCLTWMSSLTHIPIKIYVPGNHDTAIAAGMVRPEEFPEITILNHRSIEVDHPARSSGKIKIFGSPYTPTFGIGWAYNCKRGKIEKYWKDIPKDSNIVITHGPPHGINDLTVGDFRNTFVQVGCKNLLTTIQEIEPEYHIFGHLHDEHLIYNHGTRNLGDKLKTTFINASIVNLRHSVVNKPIYFDI